MKTFSIIWLLWALFVLVLAIAFIAFMVWIVIEVFDATKELGAVIGREVHVADECLAHGYPKHEIAMDGLAYCLRTIDGTDEVRLLTELE